MSVPDLLPSSPPLPWFVIIAQALGLEGVGLRDLPPELASAMAAMAAGVTQIDQALVQQAVVDLEDL